MSQRFANRLRWLAEGLLFVLLVLVGAHAMAHPMPESRVWVDTTEAGVNLTLQLPLNRLELAYGRSLSDAPQAVLASHADDLALYLLQHVGARSGLQGEGAGWTVLRPRLHVEGEDGSAELVAEMALVAPEGADRRRLMLLLDVITHEVKTHRVQVFLRHDWEGGLAGGAPLPLGELNSEVTQLPVPLQAIARGASQWRLLQDGARHILEGTDHLMFLFLLLVVAPLTASAGRWGEARPVAAALRRAALVVSAFTVGHSITLLLGSTGVLRVPAQPVEVAVALTVLLAAVQAWRPLLARGEVWMAAGFGLIHGLAFSASLSGAGLTAWQHAQALLAFNVGIELMQLALVAPVLPALLLVAAKAPGKYCWLQRLSALAGSFAAGFWLVERLA
ncbi:HupE/UreJ family protein [Ideonella margarita]|uniref:HupE/UreJ family protein n=1 Tax=Ideonella margarita TaxID=2984191 RepID=A0ABU9C2X1_9BURK